MTSRLFLDSFREKESRAKIKKEESSMGVLSTGHLELIEKLRRARVLRDIDDTKIDFTRMVILMCGDGNEKRSLDIANFHHRLAERRTPNLSPDAYCGQILALNGGALLLAEESPAIDASLREDRIFHKHLCDAVRLQKLNANGERPTVALYTHMPCGVAELHRLDPLEQMKLVALAKDRLKTAHPTWRILLCVHVHHPANSREEAKPRTYHFSRKNLNAWLKDPCNSSSIFDIRRNYGLAAARA